MKTILIATRNRRKVDEIHAILVGQFQLLTLDDFLNAPKVVEDADTFKGNATKKAVAFAEWFARIQNPEFRIQKPDFVLADDSGLEVDALGGNPGVHSARFAALDKNENSNDAENNMKLLRLLNGVLLEKRTARFCCVLALVPIFGKNENSSPVCYADGFEMQTQLFNGVCRGRIGFEPRGKNGFGYDPLFVPDGFEKTFAELSDDVKNKSSHRAKALEKLRQYLLTTKSGR